jgi:hypothetical protein
VVQRNQDQIKRASRANQAALKVTTPNKGHRPASKTPIWSKRQRPP